MTETLPDVELGVDLDAEVVCSKCPEPATLLRVTRHLEDGAACHSTPYCEPCKRKLLAKMVQAVRGGAAGFKCWAHRTKTTEEWWPL